MSTSEETTKDVDEMLRKWPDVAAPEGGYEALVERTDKRIAGDREVSDALDVFTAPSLPAVPGEPTTSGSNGEGPKLETLAALARESTVPAKRESRLPTSKEPEKKDSRSGVIDLKSMIAQSVAQETEAQKLASALEKDGAPSLGAAAAATTQPATPVPAVATAPAPQKKSSSNMLAIAAIVLIAAVGGYVMLDRNSAPRADAVASSDEQEAAAPSAAPVDRAPAQEVEDRGGADEPRPVAAPSPEPTAAADQAAQGEPAGGDEGVARERTRERHGAQREGGHGEEGAAPAGAATPPAEPPATATPAAPPPAEAPATPAPAPTKRAQADLDALISGSLGGTSSPDPSAPAANAAHAAAPEGALPQPNRQQIQRAMGRVAGAVRTCANGQSGMVMLRITFSSDGSVSSASVASGPFAGSGAAGCMENAARAARVPAFTNASVTVSYPIMVQPPDPAAPSP